MADSSWTSGWDWGGYGQRASQSLGSNVDAGAFATYTGDNWADDAFGSGNQYNHNEAVMEWQRNEASAITARDWSKMMSDTAMQRSVADYQAAGFSPLAALQGGAASTPQASVGSGSKASASGNTGKGPQWIASSLATMAMMVGAAVGSAAKMASATAAASKNNVLAEILGKQLQSSSSASAANNFVRRSRAIKF